VTTKGMACLDVISYNTNGSDNWKWKRKVMWNFGNEKEKCKPMDANKFATNESILEHTSMRAWSIKGCTSLVAQNTFHTLDIVMEKMSIQL
jgi:hypothetical protein